MTGCVYVIRGAQIGDLPKGIGEELQKAFPGFIIGIFPVTVFTEYGEGMGRSPVSDHFVGDAVLLQLIGQGGSDITQRPSSCDSVKLTVYV